MARSVTLASTVAFCLTLCLCCSEIEAPRRLGAFRDEDVEVWPWQTWTMAVLMAVICGGGQLLCCFGCIKAGIDRGDFRTYVGGVYTPLSKKEFALHAFKPDHEKIGHVLRQERCSHHSSRELYRA